jgi:hypothetical protein
VHPAELQTRIDTVAWGGWLLGRLCNGGVHIDGVCSARTHAVSLHTCTAIISAAAA